MHRDTCPAACRAVDALCNCIARYGKPGAAPAELRNLLHWAVTAPEFPRRALPRAGQACDARLHKEFELKLFQRHEVLVVRHQLEANLCRDFIARLECVDPRKAGATAFVAARAHQLFRAEIEGHRVVFPNTPLASAGWIGLQGNAESRAFLQVDDLPALCGSQHLFFSGTAP